MEPAELVAFATYEDAEAHWLANDRLNYRQVKGGQRFKTKPNDVIFELTALYAATQDRRFLGAIAAIAEHSLTVGNNWVRETPSPHVDEIVARFEEMATALVQLSLIKGVSLRLAIATCAANLRWPGNSFVAANKSIERLWRASSFNSM